jgi:hypothetical protein
MSLRKALFLFCLVISLVCLAGGFGMIGQWIGAVLVFLILLAWPLSNRFHLAWAAPACLVSLVFLAAAGLLEDTPAYLMIPGAAAALAAWDLQDLNCSMQGCSPSETARQFEKNHIRSLAIALGIGVLMAVTGSLITLHVPFAILIGLILLNLYSLDRIFSYLRNRRARGS